jgi:hypothetical protein
MTFKNKKNCIILKRIKKNSKGISYSGGGFESLYDHLLTRDGPYTEQETKFPRQCNSQVYKIISPNIEYDAYGLHTIKCVYGSLADIYIAFTEIKKQVQILNL